METDEIEIDNVYFTPFVLAYNANLLPNIVLIPIRLFKIF